MPEVLQEAGIYFNPENSDDIANALQALVGNPELREQCAAQAYEQARLYSWERCARETFTYLAEVAQTVRDKASSTTLTHTALQSHN